MFATDGSEKDPVAAYERFAEKRPENMKGDYSPFYLTVNHVTQDTDTSRKPWFKGSKIGVDKLGGLMKQIAEKAGLENSKLKNHSARKTMVQSLSDQGVPPTQIAQLSGHKNLKRI